jgi:hypothetical protein
MITIGDLTINDWQCLHPKLWRRHIIDNNLHSKDKVPNINYLQVRVVFEPGIDFPDLIYWELDFWDTCNLYSLHKDMYGIKNRVFSSEKSAMNHVDEFLIKLSRLKAFL